MKYLALFIFVLVVSAWNYVDGIHKGRAEARAEQATLESHLSHLRNLNWLLARQIEREKGGEQLNQMKP